ISICIAVLVGGILIARYTVRLDIQERAVRYLRVILLSLVLGVIVGAITPIGETINLLSESQITKRNLYELIMYNYNISPNSRYALVEYRWSSGHNRYRHPDDQKAPEWRFIDLNTGNVIEKSFLNTYGTPRFMTDDLLLNNKHSITEASGITSTIYQISSGMEIEIPRGGGYTAFSADEKHYYQTGRITFPGEEANKTHFMLTCYSFPEVHEITKVEIGGFQYVRWLDNNAIVYLDKDKKRQTIRVGE
ncbi:MAG: hypothetical protein WCJ56_08670, partial [bacterium]